MTSGVQAITPTRDTLGTVHAVLQLTKPAVTRLVVVTMACGALLAPGGLNVPRFLLAVLGTVVVVGAANALNMYLERDTDGVMDRTKNRPLPTRRVSPPVALWFGVVSSLVGLTLLTVLVNPLTALLAAVALVSYVLVYTPLKRITPLAMHVGAVPGAIPPVMGWASMVGTIGSQPVVLFLILYVWQLPHFSAIAVFRREDYERAGARVLPSVAGIESTKASILHYLMMLFLVSELPLMVDLGGPGYAATAAVLSAVFLAVGGVGLRMTSPERWARLVFLVSMPYLVLLLTALVVAHLT